MRLVICFLFTLISGSCAEVYAIFNIRPIQDAILSLDSSGIVDKIYVSEGSEVKKGDVLISLFNNDRVAQANSAKEQFIFAKNQYSRYSKTEGAIDENSLEQFYSNYKQLEANYNYYESLVEKTILKAPFDGVIAQKNIELGDGVTQNSTQLFRLISKEKKFVIEFDSKYIAYVRPGDIFTYSIDANNIKKTAVIVKVYPAIDENTRKATAEAIAPYFMFPGEFGDGLIQTKN